VFARLRIRTLRKGRDNLHPRAVSPCTPLAK